MMNIRITGKIFAVTLSIFVLFFPVPADAVDIITGKIISVDERGNVVIEIPEGKRPAVGDKVDINEPAYGGMAVYNLGTWRVTEINNRRVKAGMQSLAGKDLPKVNDSAHIYLGYMYGTDKSVQKDYGNAVTLYRKSCDGGDAQGCTNLGYMYRTGKGVIKDYGRAVTLYGKGCDGGYAQGCTNLGYMYGTGKGVIKNYGRAVTLYGKSCDGGDAHGCYNLGVMYRDGLGVQKDYNQATALFKKSCDGGDAQGCTNLAGMYEGGYGVAQDHAEAVRWYRKAAEQGFAEAQLKLALLLDTGKAAQRDNEDAIFWFRKAAQNGSDHARSVLTKRGLTLQNGTGKGTNSFTAIEKGDHQDSLPEDEDEFGEL